MGSNNPDTPLTSYWGQMSIQDKQLVQQWCLKTHGIMYAIWKKDAPEGEMQEYIEELGHAVDTGDFRFFSRVDEGGKPSTDDGITDEQANEEQTNPDREDEATEELQSLVMQSPEKVTDDELRAILRARGYKDTLEADTRSCVVELNPIQIDVPSNVETKGVEAIDKYIADYLKSYEPELSSWDWEHNDG